jgi:type IV secretory pathway protease TraF
VLKRVAALPGDRVVVSPLGLTVDGRRLLHSSRRRRDTAGRPLPAVPQGEYRVAPGTLWIYSDHTNRSWDSRYFGPVPLAGVRSTAVQLLATPRYLARLGGE